MAVVTLHLGSYYFGFSSGVACYLVNKISGSVQIPTMDGLRRGTWIPCSPRLLYGGLKVPKKKKKRGRLYWSCRTYFRPSYLPQSDCYSRTRAQYTERLQLWGIKVLCGFPVGQFAALFRVSLNLFVPCSSWWSSLTLNILNILWVSRSFFSDWSKLPLTNSLGCSQQPSIVFLQAC